MSEPEKLPTQLSFRIDDRLALQVMARAERHGGANYAARTHLERYYYLLADELRTLRGRFSLAELSLLADVVNGWLVDPLLYINVEDGVAIEQLDKKWSLPDPAGLVQKLRSLSYGQAAALIDALERWWLQPAQSGTAEGFAALGLVPAPPEKTA